MSEDSVFSFIGGTCAVLFGITGFYIWARWGWCGVQVIWQWRKRIDDRVQEEINEVLR